MAGEDLPHLLARGTVRLPANHALIEWTGVLAGIAAAYPLIQIIVFQRMRNFSSAKISDKRDAFERIHHVWLAKRACQTVFNAQRAVVWTRSGIGRRHEFTLLIDQESFKLAPRPAALVIKEIVFPEDSKTCRYSQMP